MTYETKVSFGDDEPICRPAVLVIIRNGIEIERHRDRGEPEDNTFDRDWEWVEGALDAAYRYGKADGDAALRAEVKRLKEDNERLLEAINAQWRTDCLRVAKAGK
jgi:hypothetical protein